MLKIVSVLLVTSCVVLGDICSSPEDIVPKSYDEGLITSSSLSKTHSLGSISIDKKDAKKFLDFYTALNNGDNIVPDIFGSKAENDRNICYIFFKNVYEINVQTYVNKDSIVETFNKMINLLKTEKLMTEFKLSQNSFRYNPITQKYLFFEIKELYNGVKTDDEESFDQNAKKEIDNWLINHDKLILKSDNEVKINFKKTFVFDKDEDQSDQFEISIPKDNDFFKIVVTLDKKENAMQFSKRSSSFLIFICEKNDNEATQCMNLGDQSPKSDLFWQFDVKKNQRFDVEIQESSTLFYRASTSLFNIYFIVTVKDTPGIIPQGGFNFNRNVKIDPQDHYIFCETNHKSLRVQTKPNEPFEVKSTKLTKGHLDNQTSLSIIQVLPSHLKNEFSSCQGLNKKIFVMKKNEETKNKILVVNKKDENSQVYLSLAELPIGLDQIAITGCNRPLGVDSLFYYLNPENTSKQHNRPHIYPFKAVLMRSIESNDQIKDFCVDYDEHDKAISINFETDQIELKEGEKLDFKLNFNSHDNKSLTFSQISKSLKTKNLVYLTSNPKEEFVDFKYKNFQFAEFQSKNCFVSLSKSSEGFFKVTAIFQDQKQKLIEIFTTENAGLSLSKLPSKIIDRTKNEEYKDNMKEYNLEDLNAFYLSSTEIVYSIKVVMHKKCMPIFESIGADDQNQNIIITCENTTKEDKKKYSEGQTHSEKNLSPGLIRINYQLLTNENLII